ncbi:hypothetical protein ECE50_006355 [Chitinophaga sp. Mgbs1]|uniref:YD repeat-containing protein n=1 Tax=Chitinophaga solisilvae TaxID=1233460 RepID=A0A9Q5D9Q5_9BACT|nr:hypothetical protein [Chitinophaga solisilvae]
MKRTYALKTGLLCMLLYCVQLCFAQVKPLGQSIPSPTAASLGAYGEVPVSFFSGVPGISIPIFDVKGTKLSLPLSLSYHAGGNRIETHPGWVGMGWSIIAGGAINRIVKGVFDEQALDKIQDATGYYYNKGTLNTIDWSSDEVMKAFPISRTLDEEPDEFVFNFMGFSGKFFLDEKGKWQIQGNRPLKITFNNELIDPYVVTQPVYVVETNAISKAFKQFTITDEYGNQYIFGGAGAIEYNDEIAPDKKNYRNGVAHMASTWYLSKIISANGEDVIDFTYDRGPFISSLYMNNINTSINGVGGGFLDVTCESFSYSSFPNGRIISPVYLRKIENKNFRIDFNMSKSDEYTYPTVVYTNICRKFYNSAPDTDYYLEMLQATAGIPYYQTHQLENSKYKNFVWLKLDSINITEKNSNNTYQSVLFNYNNNPLKRLELNSVSFRENLGGQTKDYSFDYNSTELPRYLEGMGDHWGFHNGGQMPAGVSNVNYLTAKTPSIDYVKARILETINYPTGGKTSFFYEMNRYAKILSNDRTSLTATAGDGGGLRISRIVNTDNAGNTTEKEYYYVSGYTAGAFPGSLPGSGILDVKPQYLFSVSGKDEQNKDFTSTIYTPNTIIPLTLNSSGLAVGYSEVVEKEKNGGYTIYKFSNHDNGDYKDIPAYNSYNRQNVPYVPFTTQDFRRGQLLEQTTYNSTGKALSKTLNEYIVVGNAATEVARAVNSTILIICKNQDGRRATTKVAYSLPYYSFLPSKQTNMLYDQLTNSYVTTVREYTYNNSYRLPTVTREQTSNGDIKRTETYYPFDFYTPADATNVHNKMLTANQLNYTIEQRNLLQSGTQTYITGGVLNTYTEQTAGKFVHSTAHVLEASGPIADAGFVKTTYNNGLQKDARYKLRTSQIYDVPNFNLKTLVQNDSQSESYIWGYNNTVPVAVVVNADSSDIAYTSFEYASDNGRWIVPPATYVADGITGKKAYSLASGNIKTPVRTTRQYIVSCWAKNAVPLVNGASPVFVGAAGNNGWKYYQYEVSSAAEITVSGSGLIDELRLYPRDAQMTTYTYDPYLGITSKCDISNQLLTYEYDGFARLKIVRDAQGKIVRLMDYRYKVLDSSDPVWKATGNSRCQLSTAGFNTGRSEQEQKDINPASPTYSTVRWVDTGVSAACPLEKWTDTGNKRCKKDANNQNTGEEEKEQKDMNPLSPTYNTVRWVSLGITNNCPAPQVIVASVEERQVSLIDETDHYQRTSNIYIVLRDLQGNKVNATNLTVNYQETYDANKKVTNTDRSVTFSGNEVLIKSGVVSEWFFNAMGTPVNYFTYDYSILPGTGYTR